MRLTNKLSPRGRRDDKPPVNGSSIRGGSTSVSGWVRCPHTAKLQAAYSLGQLRHGTNRQTDRRTDRGIA